MKTYISMLVAILATLFTANAFAWNPPTSPAPKSWISDVGGTLSPEAHARLDVRLRQINSGSANELAVLILPSLDGENIEDATNATFKAWGVGKKDLDNGVLIVLAMKEHKSRIETGKGVEGDLPDLKCNDILRNVLGPQMKQHKVEAGLEASFDAISISIANHKAEAEAAKAKAAAAPVATSAPATSNRGCDASGVGMSGGVWALLIMGMAALVIFMARRLTKKSPVQPAPKPTIRARQYVAPAPVVAAVAPPPVPVRPAPVPPPLPKKAKVSGITKRPSAPPRPSPKPMKKTVVAAAAATTSIVAEVEALNIATRARVKREREEREEEDRRARRAQEAREEREEEERRRKRREEDEERSSSSSSSTFDWGGGSSGGGSDSGSGGFGGGDSGGGGSSSDW